MSARSPQQMWLRIALGTVLVAALALGLRLLFPSPTVVVMTTGPKGSAYEAYGQRYREILARAGVELRLAESAGAVENLERLNDPRAGVSVGFSQGGLTDARQSPDAVSLGNVFYEPLWFFCRGQGCGAEPRAMRGNKVALGPEGSGTRTLAERLLALNGIDPGAAQVLPLTAAESADALLRGEIVAAAMVASWDTPAVRDLLASSDVELFDFPRADAYAALYPYLTKLVVPEGVGNLAANRPPADVSLLALTASLVVRADTDRAMQYLLLDAATQIHSAPGIFQKAGQFPAPEGGDLPVSTDAQQFYKTGLPFLQRYLPFQLAVLASRLLVVLVPLLGIVYPLLRYAPALYAWNIRRRIFLLYGELKLIELDLDKPVADVNELDTRLDRLEERAGSMHIPLAFAQILYNMRSHIGLARARLEATRERLNVYNEAGIPLRDPHPQSRR